jgi:hypothetical protein
MWAHGQFESGRAFVLMHIVNVDGSGRMSHAAFSDHESVEIVRYVSPPPLLSHDSEAADAYTLEFETASGRVMIQAEVLHNAPITFAGPTEWVAGLDRETPDAHHLIFEGHTRFELDGDVGYGLTERTGAPADAARRRRMMMSTTSTHDWGPLSSVPDGPTTWKDNAYFPFWDPSTGVFGAAHVSTSPHPPAEGRRARFSISVDGNVIQFVEPLEPGSFESPSLDGVITIDSPRVSGRLQHTPRFAVADYTPGGTVLMGGDALHHYEQTTEVSGHLVVDGRELEIHGRGGRDRTWGHRDESKGLVGYFWILATFETFSLTCLRLITDDGRDLTDGFRMTQDARPITGVSTTRDASSLCVGARFTLADGEIIDVRATDRPAGFWVPMSWERNAPTLGEYDEFCALRTSGGEDGFAVIGHAQVRNVF